MTAAEDYVVKVGQLEARWPGGTALLVQGEQMPAQTDPDQLAHFVATDAVETKEQAQLRAVAAEAAAAADEPSTPESAAAAIDAAAARAAAAAAPPPVDVSTLSGDALAEWFKGKQLKDLVGLSGEQALALHEIEDSKPRNKREPILAALTAIVEADTGTGDNQ